MTPQDDTRSRPFEKVTTASTSVGAIQVGPAGATPLGRRYTVTHNLVLAIQAGHHELLPVLVDEQLPMLLRTIRGTKSDLLAGDEHIALVYAAFIEAVYAVDPKNKVGPWIRWKTRRTVLSAIARERTEWHHTRLDLERHQQPCAGELTSWSWRTVELGELATMAGIGRDDFGLIRQRCLRMGWRRIAIGQVGEESDEAVINRAIERCRKRHHRAIGKMKAVARKGPPEDWGMQVERQCLSIR